jgi:hypothetical protein
MATNSGLTYDEVRDALAQGRQVQLTDEGIAVPGEVAAMDEGEARAAVERMRGHVQELWHEFQAFHAGRGWEALGYASFKACLAAEFHTSEQHAYRLLDAAGIHAELAAALPPATHHVVSLDRMTEAHARVLKPLPPAERVAVVRTVDFRTTSARALRERVQAQQPAPALHRESVNATPVADADAPLPEETLANADLRKVRGWMDALEEEARRWAEIPRLQWVQRAYLDLVADERYAFCRTLRERGEALTQLADAMENFSRELGVAGELQLPRTARLADPGNE